MLEMGVLFDSSFSGLSSIIYVTESLENSACPMLEGFKDSFGRTCGMYWL